MKLKYLFVTALVGLLAVSVVLNYFFYKKAFIPLHAVKLDPLELNYYPSTSAPAATNSVMFYGDSRALSWPSPEGTGQAFVNRAIGNQTSVQILGRFDAHVTPHKPKTILIQVCVNDLKMIPLFPNRKEQIIEACKSNITAMLEKSHALGAQVILSTVFPLGDVSIARQALGTTEPPIIDGISRINDFIKTQQSDNTVIFDSYELLLGENNKIDPQYSHDWLHLNKAGYEHLNQALTTFIK